MDRHAVNVIGCSSLSDPWITFNTPHVRYIMLYLTVALNRRVAGSPTTIVDSNGTN